MSKILELLCTEYENVYGLKMKKDYSTPKIYHGGKDYDLTKRWYVYFSFRHPETGKLVRQNPIFAKFNSLYKTKKERLTNFNILRETLENFLKDGYSPYKNEPIENEYSASSALDFALELKEKTVSPSTYKGYYNRVNVFTKYLKGKGLDIANIKSIDKKIVTEFLNQTLRTSGASNRNNYRQDLSAVFSVLVENDYIEYNFIEKIKKINSKPTRNKTYSQDKVDEIYKELETSDPLLLLFIKFVSYNFLRPVEVVRLKVKDINLKDGTLTVLAKNKAHKTKIIPDILIKELNKLELKNPEHYLFTPKGVGEWVREESGKRTWFSNRFNKVKEELGIGSGYTVYSFRHTSITKLYRELRKQHSKSETENKVMLITGHSTLVALQKYLRDIDAELPEDYSDLL
ncbi:MAG TPA: integrase [Lutibacter sp.]|nr:integrase [Lutibacter sp.]